MEWIIGITIYLVTGVYILVYSIKDEPWGGLALHIWWLIVFFYPLLIIKMLFEKSRP